MAQIELRLSSKIQKETGKSEIMIRFFYTKHDFYANSEVFVDPSFFEYYVDRKKTVNPKKPLPENKNTTTLDKAKKNGWAVRKSGIIMTSNRQIKTAEVAYHEAQAKRIAVIEDAIINAYNSEPNKDGLTSKWLKGIIYKCNHPEHYIVEEKKTFYDYAEEYITVPHGGRATPLAEAHQRAFRVLIRAVARYEGFIRATDKERPNYHFDINTITRDDLEDFSSYLKNEHTLKEEYPKLFKKLLTSYPISIKNGQYTLRGRGDNTVKNMLSRLKTLFLYFVERGYTKNRPFDGYVIGMAIYGTPVYITIEERNKIADTDLAAIWETMPKEERDLARMPIKTLIAQRDIFIFQCFVGCRVGDLVKFTDNYISNGILVYTPHKTKDESEQVVQARVPLHPKALALIEKYRGVDSQGRLFPFVTSRRYNDALKVIFKMAGITRNVEVRNPKTGENEIVPINTIASSHLARRTFIGNAYFKVSDPNLIGKMSGHVDGSKAFKRYRKIEDDTLRDVINLLD